MTPTVSFIVPCFKLAHFLGECLRSILAQSFEDFEILVMDDQSPDHTPEVVRGFADARIVHVRNEKNLGHLANYNKGIASSRGRYVWLISADDSLLAHHVLQRFVELMEREPKVGYVFCPVIPHVENREVDIAPYWYQGPDDAVFDGRAFLSRLKHGNCVPAPSGMARRACYERIGHFPLDLPYAGDWYLWSAFAAEFDVGYLAEPMVRYRWHDTNITHQLRNRDSKLLLKDDLAVLWRIARRLGDLSLHVDADEWWSQLIDRYAMSIAEREARGGDTGLSIADARASWERNVVDRKDRDRGAVGVYLTLADRLYHQGQIRSSRALYWDALSLAPSLPVGLKYVLACSGAPGVKLRKAATVARRVLGAS